MNTDAAWTLVTHPAWRPFTTDDRPGYLAVAACAAALTLLTLWAYLGNAAATRRRIALLVVLRLLALALTLVTMVRPSIAVTEQPLLPSTLLVVMDASESMSVNDESDRQSRYDAVMKAYARAEPLFDQLRQKQQCEVEVYQFADDFKPTRDLFTPPGRRPDGKGTDFGTMLKELYDRHAATRHLRGLLILSDGADNGRARPALAEALKWRNLGCRIYPFVAGQTSTQGDQKDIAFTEVSTDPTDPAIQTVVKVRAVLSAQKLEGARVRVKLYFDGEEQRPDNEEFTLAKTTGNVIEMTTRAPAKPGEYKVTLKIVDGPAGEVTLENNQIETYMNVTRDRIGVLVIDKQRLELKFLRQALATDKRIDATILVRQTNEPALDADGQPFDLAKSAYDAIIIGDVSPTRLEGIQPGITAAIRRLVTERGCGLMMTGGVDSFGGSKVAGSAGWGGTALADILPVKVPGRGEQYDDPALGVGFIPTADGQSSYLMRLDADPAKNKAIWARLNDKKWTRMAGYSNMGAPQANAVPYARVEFDKRRNDIFYAGRTVEKGRTLAFAGDQTWKWLALDAAEDRPEGEEGAEYHARFWKQAVRWLARQEEAEGNVVALPKLRMMSQSGENTIRLRARDKAGDPIRDAEFDYQILKPGETPDRAKARKPARDADGGLVTHRPTQPGEYTVVVWGQGKNPDGTEVAGDASAKYIVTPEITQEMLNPAANPDFLLALENTANLSAPDAARRVDRFAGFVEEELVNKPLRQTGTRPKLTPDWRREGSRWFLPLLVVLFVGLLGLEWGLRRAWGMV